MASQRCGFSFPVISPSEFYLIDVAVQTSNKSLFRKLLVGKFSWFEAQLVSITSLYVCAKFNKMNRVVAFGDIDDGCLTKRWSRTLKSSESSVNGGFKLPIAEKKLCHWEFWTFTVFLGTSIAIGIPVTWCSKMPAVFSKAAWPNMPSNKIKPTVPSLELSVGICLAAQQSEVQQFFILCAYPVITFGITRARIRAESQRYWSIGSHQNQQILVFILNWL